MPTVVWSDDSTLLMSEIMNCETLYDYLESHPNEALNLAPLIGQCIAVLHNLGIIHGDLTTSNLLLMPRINDDPIVSKTTTTRAKKSKSTCTPDSHIVIPIDFGLSTGSTHPEERAVDLYVLERALLSTHFSDSTFFNLILDEYQSKIDENTCGPLGKEKIIERLHEVRARGRKSDYSNDNEDGEG